MKTTEHDRGRWRRLGHRIGLLSGATAFAAIGLTWMWRTVAQAEFAAPALRFSDALAVVVALVLLAVAIGYAWRVGRGDAV